MEQVLLRIDLGDYKHQTNLAAQFLVLRIGLGKPLLRKLHVQTEFAQIAFQPPLKQMDAL